MEVKAKCKNIEVSNKLLMIFTALGLDICWNTVQAFDPASDLCELYSRFAFYLIGPSCVLVFLATPKKHGLDWQVSLFLIQSVLHPLVSLMVAVVNEELHFHTSPDVYVTHLFHYEFKQ